MQNAIIASRSASIYQCTNKVSFIIQTFFTVRSKHHQQVYAVPKIGHVSICHFQAVYAEPAEVTSSTRSSTRRFFPPSPPEQSTASTPKKVQIWWLTDKPWKRRICQFWTVVILIVVTMVCTVFLINQTNSLRGQVGCGVTRFLIPDQVQGS